MALIKCPECSTEVSSRAPNCPKCGCPVESEAEKDALVATAVRKARDNVELMERERKTAPFKIIFNILLVVTIVAAFLRYQIRKDDSFHRPPISTITWSENDAIYNIKSKHTDLQKDEIYRGKAVQWSGKVASVSDGITGLSMQVKMNPGTFVSDVLVKLKPSQKQIVMDFIQGEDVTFAGVLTTWGTLLPIGLSDGEILQ